MVNIRTEKKWNEDRVNLYVCMYVCMVQVNDRFRYISSNSSIQNIEKERKCVEWKWMSANQLHVHILRANTYTMYIYMCIRWYYSTRLFSGSYSEHTHTHKHKHTADILMVVFIHRKIEKSRQPKKKIFRYSTHKLTVI